MKKQNSPIIPFLKWDENKCRDVSLKYLKSTKRCIRDTSLQGFTLVELIVVVTILAILSAIGFVAYSGYMAGVRDTNRVSQLKSISDGLELYRNKHDLPLPNDYVEVKSSGSTIAYQGYVGKGVLEAIEYSSEGVDPKDGSYFSYYLTKDKKYYQLMAFLEEDSNLQNKQAFNNKNVGVPFMGTLQAADYSNRYPTVYGKKLGILTNADNTPIQEIDTIKTNGLDVKTTTTEYIAHFKDSEPTLKGTGAVLTQILPNASCKRIKELKGGSTDGVYTIDPEGNGTGFKVYCDMTTDGGGWTLVHKTTSNSNDLGGNITDTTGNPDWNSYEEYRLSINYWKKLSTQKVMAINIDTAGHKWEDIEDGIITYIGTNKVNFSGNDIYRIFNSGTSGNSINTCTSGTPYWNTSCCSRCVNYDNSSSYGTPENSPMIYKGSTSTNLDPTSDGAGGSGDATRFRLKKMGIFIK